MLTFTSAVGKLNVRVLWHHRMLLQVISQSYCQVFVKSYNLRPFLSTCYGYPSTTEVPPCCQAATKKLTFSTTSVLLLLNVPLSLSRGTDFRRQKNPRRGYRPKIAGILFVCNEPEGKYYTVPIIAVVVANKLNTFFGCCVNGPCQRPWRSRQH